MVRKVYDIQQLNNLGILICDNTLVPLQKVLETHLCLGVNAVRKLSIQILEKLSKIHEIGETHGNLSPSSILMDE